MKPAWDKLGDEFANSKTAVIGDVDCTVHKDLCSRFGVRGYPTIKFFTSNPEGDDSKGGRDYDSLLSFAKENLGPSCSWPDNKDLCDEEQLKFLEEKAALSAEDRQAEIDEIEGKIKDLKDGFETFLEGLQNQYEEAKKKMDDDVKALQPDLRLLKVITSDDAKEEL
jgi:thioredoxin-like negative regulator of GroEL